MQDHLANMEPMHISPGAFGRPRLGDPQYIVKNTYHASA